MHQLRVRAAPPLLFLLYSLPVIVLLLCPILLLVFFFLDRFLHIVKVKKRVEKKRKNLARMGGKREKEKGNASDERKTNKS